MPSSLCFFSVFFLLRSPFMLTHDSALPNSAHLLCVCVFAPVSLHEAGVEASRHWGLGKAYPKTVESSPQDSINQSRLISFDTTLSAAEVANYHTQWLHHDLLYSPYDACAFCPPLVNQQKMNRQLLISNCSSTNARSVLFPGCPVRICYFSTRK